MDESPVLYSLGIIGVSAFGFQAISVITKDFLTPSTLTSQYLWKWKNIFVSLVHSVITGLWAVSCFYHAPHMAEDLISTITRSAQCLVAISIGYFVYDTVDMLRYSRSRQTVELLLHHAVILVCFGIAVVRQQYIGYAVVSLIVELNSIFLHIRHLQQYLGYQKENYYYRLNSLFNLGTYIIFRISTVAWMTRWLVVNQGNELIPFPIFACGSLGLTIITVMNIILFYRLLRSDFMQKERRPAVNGQTATNNNKQD